MLDKTGLRRLLRCRCSILHRQLLRASRRALLLALPLLPVSHTELTFQDVRATIGADTHKNMHQSLWQQRLYPHIQFLRAASYSVGAHSALVHEINCDSDDDDDETTDAGEVVDAQTADDPQQNDVCEVCLVAAWSKLNNSNSDARLVARKTRWCCGCSNYPFRRLAFLLSVRLSVCLSVSL